MCECVKCVIFQEITLRVNFYINFFVVVVVIGKNKVPKKVVKDPLKPCRTGGGIKHYSIESINPFNGNWIKRSHALIKSSQN